MEVAGGPNLNKLLSDRRANISPERIDERVRAEVKKAFTKSNGLDVVLFPEKSGNVTDRPALTLAVLPSDQTMEDADATKKLIESMTREHGRSSSQPQQPGLAAATAAVRCLRLNPS